MSGGNKQEKKPYCSARKGNCFRANENEGFLGMKEDGYTNQD